MFISSQAALSNTVQVIVSGNFSAIALAQLARYVGLQTFGGASTSHRAHTLPLARVTPLAIAAVAAAAAH